MILNNKLLLFFLIFLALSSNAQVWQYPYEISGLEEVPVKKKARPYSVAIIDSTGDGMYTYYNSYDEYGRKIRSIENGADTAYFYYDKYNYNILTIYGNKDSVSYNFERDTNDRIVKFSIKRKQKVTNMYYKRNVHGDVIEVYVDTNLYDRIAYDEQHRITRVEKYRHAHQGLSDIVSYSYSGDTVSYESCPYDVKAKRYEWPCEVTTGVLNENGDLLELSITYHNAISGEYIQATDSMWCSYDKKGRILEVIDRGANGGGTNTFYTRYKKGRIQSIKVINTVGVCYMSSVFKYD